MNAPWSNAPIFYALAHIQFNSIPAMPTYYPGIADRLRKTGYPDPQDEKQSVVSFGMTIGGNPDAQKFEPRREVLRWRFSNIEKTACFLLLQDALIYQTTCYSGRDAFFAEACKGLEVVHDIVKLDFVDRIGVRFLDAVIPGEGETLDQYLVPEVLGLGRKLNEGLQHSMVEAVAQLSYGILISRAYTVPSQGGCPPIPPELLPLPLAIQSRFNECDGRLIAILDNDCFIQNRVDFLLPNIMETLQQLREGIGLAFDSSITPFAKERWK